MNETVYILLILSLLALFLINKYEKEKLQVLLQQELLTNPAFCADIQERLSQVESENDVIAHIHKTYRIGILYAKEIVEKVKHQH